jgi:hypothetical protein
MKLLASERYEIISQSKHSREKAMAAFADCFESIRKTSEHLVDFKTLDELHYHLVSLQKELLEA